MRNVNVARLDTSGTLSTITPGQTPLMHWAHTAPQPLSATSLRTPNHIASNDKHFYRLYELSSTLTALTCCCSISALTDSTVRCCPSQKHFKLTCNTLSLMELHAHRGHQCIPLAKSMR
eukprot:1157119-Pelagomonas_calceolata.AAC.7